MKRLFAWFLLHLDQALVIALVVVIAVLRAFKLANADLLSSATVGVLGVLAVTLLRDRSGREALRASTTTSANGWRRAELLDSTLCACAAQLGMAMQRLHDRGGLLFYLRFDGRGAGLAAKVRATALEVSGADTCDSRVQIGVPPEGRTFPNESVRKLYRVKAARFGHLIPSELATEGGTGQRR